MQFLKPPSCKGPLRGVILDWAGTCIDHGSQAPIAALLKAFESLGITITTADARASMGKSKRDHIRDIMSLPHVSLQWHERNNRQWTEADIDQFFDDFIPFQMAVLDEHSELIPGVADTVAHMRRQGLRIGTTTGYNADMMRVIVSHAKAQGFDPESVCCSTDTPEGRPAPWMCFLNAQRLGIYPMCSIVKIGDTPVDILEGRNAGCWTIGIVRTGNEMGFSLDELSALSNTDFDRHYREASAILQKAGAHYLADSVAEVLPILDDIRGRLLSGEHP